MLHGILQNRQIISKNQITNTNSTAKSTVADGAETWKYNKKLLSNLMSLEMDLFRRSARYSRLERSRNTIIRENILLKNLF